MSTERVQLLATLRRHTSHVLLAPVIVALLLVALAASFAIEAGGAAMRFLPRLNIERPALASVPPTLTEPAAPLSRRVVLVIVDGLTVEASRGLPYLDELRRRGLDLQARSTVPTISRPNYVSIVTGVPPAASGVRTNDYGWPVALDSIMDRARAADMQAVYVSDLSSGFGRMFAQDLHDTVYAPWNDGFVRSARLAIERGSELVVLLPGAVDRAGHGHGARSAAYRDAAALVDAQLRASLYGVDLARDTVIVTADHGHVAAGGHGGVEREVLRVPLIVAGAGVGPARTAATDDIDLTDIAPTIGALLGVAAPGHGLGHTRTELLALTDGARAAITTADRTRITRNQAVVAASLHEAADEVAVHRARRVPLALAVAALAVALMLLARRLGAIHVDWRVLASALPVFPFTFYLLLHLAGRISLSAVTEEGEVIGQVTLVAALAVIAQAAATWATLRGRVELRQRLAAAGAIAMGGILVAGAPVLTAWAWMVGPCVDLPHPTLLFLVPSMYIAVAAYAIGNAVTLGLELVVYFARAFDSRRLLDSWRAPGPAIAPAPAVAPAARAAPHPEH